MPTRHRQMHCVFMAQQHLNLGPRELHSDLHTGERAGKHGNITSHSVSLLGKDGDCGLSEDRERQGATGKGANQQEI